MKFAKELTKADRRDIGRCLLAEAAGRPIYMIGLQNLTKLAVSLAKRTSVRAFVFFPDILSTLRGERFGLKTPELKTLAETPSFKARRAADIFDHMPAKPSIFLIDLEAACWIDRFKIILELARHGHTYYFLKTDISGKAKAYMKARGARPAMLGDVKLIRMEGGRDGHVPVSVPEESRDDSPSEDGGVPAGNHLPGVRRHGPEGVHDKPDNHEDRRDVPEDQPADPLPPGGPGEDRGRTGSEKRYKPITYDRRTKPGPNNGNFRGEGKPTYEAQYDSYQTPPWVTKALLRQLPDLKTISTVIDPCAGRGAMVKVLCEAREGRTVVASDIRPLPGIETEFGRIPVHQYDIMTDEFEAFIKKTAPNAAIFNPPFAIKGETNGCAKLIRRVIDLMPDGATVAVFQRLQFLESVRRYDILFARGDLVAVYIFTHRPQLFPEGHVDNTKGGSMSFAWYIFKAGRRDQVPLIYWIDEEPKVYKDPFLPQEVGMCYCCKYRKTEKCAPKAKGRRKSVDEAEIGRSVLCVNWQRAPLPYREERANAL